MASTRSRILAHVPEIHTVVGVALLALNAAAGVWGLLVWRGVVEPGRAFAQVLALSHTVVFGQAVLGLYLLSGPGRAAEPLHYVYGLLPGALVVFAYSARTEDTRRNALVFAIVALIIAGLGTRAYTTGPG